MSADQQERERLALAKELEAEVLRSIKAGEVSFRDVEQMIPALLDVFSSVEGSSTLPDEPDFEAASDLLVRVIRRANS